MTALSDLPLTSSGSGVVFGSTTPRLWTPPLRELTPETSFGFELIEFADRVVGEPFDPWQEWLAVHVGELLPDGRPRFRIVLILISRQNGKTHFAKVLSLWWLFVDLPGRRRGKPTVLGTSSKLDYAREAWSAAVDSARDQAEMSSEVPRNGVRESNGEQTLSTVHRTRYKIAAANSDAGRSLTVDRLLLDELRQHHDWTAWNAAEPTTNSIADAQIVALSNQGDDRAVVLDSLRSSALSFIDTGDGDQRLGVFEWSSPDGADPTDVAALAQANPALGRRIEVDSLLGAAIRAKTAGGDQLAGFRIEYMCQKVPILNPAIDATSWEQCLVPGNLEEARGRVALCVDVSLDQQHATLVAAAVLPVDEKGVERIRVEVVKAWSGPSCTRELRRDLPGLVRKIRPRAVGWWPAGPAAAVAAALADRKRSRLAWPPPGVRVEEMRQEQTAAAMGFSEMVRAEEIVHSADPLLDAHVTGAERLPRGDAWTFTRRGGAHVDGAYAAAGAVHLARTLPAPRRPKVITSTRRRDT